MSESKEYLKAAVVILENENGEYLMVHRVTKPLGWGFPGGKPEIEDINLAATATRELFEETNISKHVNEENSIGTVISANDSYEMEVFHLKVSDQDSYYLKLSLREHNGYVWTNQPYGLNLAGATGLILELIMNA